MNHANMHNILYPLQHGFRARRSCETQLIDLVNDTANNMQSGLQTDICVLDFAKAFDKVSHIHLIHKLRWYGIMGELNRWINNFLRDRTQRVVLESASSDEVPVASGVPQESVLGPCLFLFYINDVAVGLSSTVRLFAYDTLLYLTVQNNKDAELLQHDLDTLCQWEATSLMEFHPDKCEVIIIIIKEQIKVT